MRKLRIILPIVLIASTIGWLAVPKPKLFLVPSNYSVRPISGVNGTVIISVGDSTGNSFIFSSETTGSIVSWTQGGGGYDIRGVCWPKLFSAEGGPASLRSPDQKMTVACTNPKRIEVKDDTGVVMGVREFGGPTTVKAMAWSPDANALAVLTQDERYDYSGLGGVLSCFSGHPRLLIHLRAYVWVLRTNEFREVPFDPNELLGGWGSINWARTDGR